MIGKWKVKKLWFGYTIQECVSEWALGAGYRYARDPWGRVEIFYTKEGAQAEADRRNQLRGITDYC